jgi:hypothetical protein
LEVTAGRDNLGELFERHFQCGGKLAGPQDHRASDEAFVDAPFVELLACLVV